MRFQSTHLIELFPIDLPAGLEIVSVAGHEYLDASISSWKALRLSFESQWSTGLRIDSKVEGEEEVYFLKVQQSILSTYHGFRLITRYTGH